jgi:hypothetical protein
MKGLHPIDWEEMGYILHEDAIKFDGCDSAIIGVTSEGFLCYSFELLVDKFVTQDEMTFDEAVEWVEFNVLPIEAHESVTIIYTQI